MNKSEIIEHLVNNGIKQLNKGESVSDALQSIEECTLRKGYKIKRDNGQLMTDNEIIAEENKVAFAKTITPKEYNEDSIEDIGDICDDNDQRSDKTLRGAIVNCFYCGDCIRVDGDEDYLETTTFDNCHECSSNAIYENCM